MGKNIDLTGKRFGKLTVLDKSDRKGKNSYWICRCDCGITKEICATALKAGQSSCGCSAFDFAKDKVIGNEYEILEDGVVRVVLRTGDIMLCDADDWETLKEYTWTKDAWGYASASINRKRKKFHTQIIESREGYVIDHIDRNKLNNQKSNLRHLTKCGNAINSKLSKNNTSGAKGVCKNASGKKWIAQIMLRGKHIHLGTFDSMEEALEARNNAERKYFVPIIEEENNNYNLNN